MPTRPIIEDVGQPQRWLPARLPALLAMASVAAALAADPADLVREAAQGWTQGAVKQDAAALVLLC